MSDTALLKKHLTCAKPWRWSLWNHPSLILHQRRQCTIFITNIFERKKVKACHCFPGKDYHIKGMETKLKLVTRRWKSKLTFKNQINRDIKRPVDVLRRSYGESGVEVAIRKVQRQVQRQQQRQMLEILGGNTTFFLGSSLSKWQERIKKHVTIRSFKPNCI